MLVAQFVPRSSSLARVKATSAFMYNRPAYFGRSGETAYAADSKSAGATHGGSNPPSGTQVEKSLNIRGFLPMTDGFVTMLAQNRFIRYFRENVPPFL